MKPEQHLQALTSKYPLMNKWVNHFLVSKGRDLPTWPDWCFLPMAAWYSMVSANYQVERLPLNLIHDVSQLAAIGTWRYTQGIFKIDPDTSTELMRSPISGNIPSEILYRLPEWSVYLETPGQNWEDLPMYGFWAHMEWDVSTERHELRLLINCGAEQLVPFPLHIGRWTIVEAIDKATAEASRQAEGFIDILPPNWSEYQDVARGLSGQVARLISLLLYLCLDEPEIENVVTPDIRPTKPRPKKTKKGVKIFPASGTKTWNVGRDTGNMLRQSVKDQEYDVTGKPTERSVRSHIRRGHWHGYWTGPRKGERRFVYHWIHPLLVRGDKKRNARTLT
jgi:hypothetical protein